MKLKSFVKAVFVFFLFWQLCTKAQIPERVILNLTADPATSTAISWRLPEEKQNSCVQYAESERSTEFSKKIKIQKALGRKVLINDSIPVFHYASILTGLNPDSRYVYRVGHDSVWSEWNQFTTASNQIKPFTFVWFGDPQDNITEYCSRVFRQALITSSAASFWLFSGDITSEPVDSQLGELFTAAGFIFRTIPAAMVPGNHDMGYKMEDGKIVINKKGKKERLKSVSPLWNSNFTLPHNGIQGLEGTSYTFDYQGVRFFMLNSNCCLQEQAAWMEKLLSDNPNKWTVAVFHHPLYSSGRERDDRETRNVFLKLFDEYSVDLVLTGHDHTYSRSMKLKNNRSVPDSEKGTVYITSVSGPKQYSVNSEYKDLMVKIAGEAQLFQEINVNGNTLNFKAFTADGKLFDSFDLKK